MSVDFFPMPRLELLFTQKCNMACTYCFEPDKNQKKMTKQQIIDFVDNISATSLMVFGGEPLLDIDLLSTLYDAIEAKQMDETLKQQLLKSFTLKDNLITNGTLIEKNLDIIKKYHFVLQISIDGPKELHNLNRIYRGGAGTYDDIIKGIDLCIANDIPWGVHGVLGENGFKYLPAIFDFNLMIAKKQTKGNMSEVVRILGGNMFQIMFEDEYTDEGIDTFLLMQEEIFNKIFAMEDITEPQRIQLLQGWFCRHGSPCMAGNDTFSLDPDFNIYTCHRPAMDGTDSSLGNLSDRGSFHNFKYFDAYFDIDKSQKMYSAATDVNAKDRNTGFGFQQNWCPAGNFGTSGSIFYQSAKYNILLTEYTRFVRELFDYAKIPLSATN